jgi:FKBP-type peptidyl-prolyl cis-trans isomerase 2
MKRLGILLACLLILVMVIGAIGCSKQEEITPSPTPTETPTVHPTPTAVETERAKIGDTVKVHYTGRLGNGTVFDSSIGRDPLQFTLGQGQMIQGFEQAIIGMAVGEHKTVSIPSAEAYGSYRDDLVVVMDRTNLPPDWKPEIGNQYYFTAPDGSLFQATVTEMTESTVTIDANHPLAGKDLIFDIELVEIVQ